VTHLPPPGTEKPTIPLEKEIETYDNRLPELLKDEGKFVLIVEEQIVGIFDTFEETMKAGYSRFRSQPFLARQISKTDPIIKSSRSVRPCHMSQPD
jgi:hypothetical protein